MYRSATKLRSPQNNTDLSFIIRKKNLWVKRSVFNSLFQRYLSDLCVGSHQTERCHSLLLLRPLPSGLLHRLSHLVIASRGRDEARHEPSMSL
uniref:Uncharacterized protein n=1 Tax=Salix viminalis TaxID=40686 RepID=A0A6N2K7C1_SALVM